MIEEYLTLTNFTRGRDRAIDYIVMHYTANDGDTAMGNANYFHSTYRGASAHYFVDPDSVVRVVADADVAWHCGTKWGYNHPECRNSNSIGVEMCSCKNSKGAYYIPDETQARAAELVAELMEQYGIPMDSVIRHYDVTGKPCPEPMVAESAWAKFKERLTMTESKIRAVVRDEMEKIMSKMDNAPASQWAMSDLAVAVEIGITDGTRPQGLVTREQAAIMALRAREGVE